MRFCLGAGSNRLESDRIESDRIESDRIGSDRLPSHRRDHWQSRPQVQIELRSRGVVSAIGMDESFAKSWRVTHRSDRSRNVTGDMLGSDLADAETAPAIPVV